MVAGHGEGELEAEFFGTSEHGPCEPTNRLAPPERFLDTLSLLLAHHIAAVPRGTGVDGGPSAADVLGDVRRHVELAHVGDERRRVIALSAPRVMRRAPGEW